MTDKNLNLDDNDHNHVVRRIPKDIRKLLTKFHGKLFLGGGFIRAVVAGEEPADIDLFGESQDLLVSVAEELQRARGGKNSCRLHHTKNAVTVISFGRMTVQFITRWEFSDATSLMASFDFTVCQAAIYREGGTKESKWVSTIGPRFYLDLAARRLHYTNPVRDEEAGGSLLRVLKYQRRGYVIQIESLAGVVARLISAIDQSKCDIANEKSSVFVLHGLLQEVDPSIVVDGLDLTDDHETPIEGLLIGELMGDSEET